MSGNGRRLSIASAKLSQGDKKSNTSPQTDTTQNRPPRAPGQAQPQAVSDKTQTTSKSKTKSLTADVVKPDERKSSRRNSTTNTQTNVKAQPSQACFDQEREDYTCPDCKKPCTDDEAALECEFCERWFHASCQNVNDQLYQAIQADSAAGSNILHWYCNTSCNFFAKKIVNNMFSLRRDIDAVSGAVAGLTTRVENLEDGDIPKKMEDSIRRIVKEEATNDEVKEKIQELESFRDIMNEQRQESFDNNCKQIEAVNRFMIDKAREQQLEADDRARRQTNLIIFDIPESNAPTGEMKKKEDIEKIGQILEDIGVEHNPTFSKRLFKKETRDIRSGATSEIPQLNEEGTDTTTLKFGFFQKCTPLLVKFENQTIRDEVLSKFIAAKKDAEEDEYEGEEDKLYLKVRMKRDMTKLEREEDFAIYKEIKARREQSKNEGDNFARWVQRNGRVINIGRYPRRSYQPRSHLHH